MMDNSDKLFIGIDVSKATLEVAQGQISKTQVLDNTEAGIAQLVALLKQPGAPIGVVLLEATGGFERECAMALCLADLAVIVVNPRQARDFAKAMGYLPRPTRWMPRCCRTLRRLCMMAEDLSAGCSRCPRKARPCCRPW